MHRRDDDGVEFLAVQFREQPLGDDDRCRLAVPDGEAVSRVALYLLVPATRGLARSRSVLLVLAALLAFLLLAGRDSLAGE